MSTYSAIGTQTVTATTALGIVATAAVRPRIVDVTFSQVGVVSTDSQFRVQAKRFTAAGTSTAFTPVALDPGDPASTFTAGANHSAEPTFTANTTLLDVSVNPRGTFRWVAYDPSGEMVAPATAANGIGFTVATLGGATTVVVSAVVKQ